MPASTSSIRAWCAASPAARSSRSPACASSSSRPGAWMSEASLRGRTVLVTGADGFMGSHLVERLVAEGARVRAFCLYNSQGSWGWLDAAAPEVRGALDVRLGDVRD